MPKLTATILSRAFCQGLSKEVRTGIKPIDRTAIGVQIRTCCRGRKSGISDRPDRGTPLRIGSESARIVVRSTCDQQFVA